jgi:hypothetical protein
MTLITFQDGKPVLRDGAVGTEQACCCGCFGCVIDGQVKCQYTTKESCEECTRTYQCHERVNTECDGDCPEGYEPYTDSRTAIRITFANNCWPQSYFDYSTNTSFVYFAVVDEVVIGCGQILSATIASQSGKLAKLGHVAPTVTAAPLDSSYCVQGGSGAVLGVTLEEVDDPLGCGLRVWRVASVQVISGGSGYVADQYSGCPTIAFTAGLSREPPTLTASATGGSGGSLTVSIAENAVSPKTWRVSGIAVAAGGSGYADGASVTVTAAAGDTTQAGATASVRTSRVAPTVAVNQLGAPFCNGTGAVVTVTMAETANWQGSGRSVWRATAFQVVNGGSGYVEWDLFFVTVTDGTMSAEADCYVLSVDENGAVLEVELSSMGVYYKNTGVIESVVVSNAGQYYGADPEPNPITLQEASAQVAEVDENGAILSVAVTDGGAYYREVPTVDPYVATPTVTITGGYGSGAVIVPTIDTDTSSPTFGQITSLDVTDGGSGYLALCERTRSVSSCEDCPPRDLPEYSQCDQASAEGPCGTWQRVDCDEVDPESPCCESCLPECSFVPPSWSGQTAGGYYRQSTLNVVPNSMWGAAPYRQDWTAPPGCTLWWEEIRVNQTEETANLCYTNPINGNKSYAFRTWVLHRVLLLDCRTQEVRDITSEALSAPYGGVLCLWNLQWLGNTPPPCDEEDCIGDNPGFPGETWSIACP